MVVGKQGKIIIKAVVHGLKRGHAKTFNTILSVGLKQDNTLEGVLGEGRAKAGGHGHAPFFIKFINGCW